MTDLLQIKSLTVKRSGREILNNLDLKVEKGEFIGLIGPNGAGKTTLLKAILNLLPFVGDIELAGQDTRQLSQLGRARHTSYLPQEREINWPLKVRDVVALGGSYINNASHDEARQSVELAMKKMDILDLADRRATNLSGGEMARVLFARTLAQDAPLLLADEPVAGLDPAHQLALMQRLAVEAAEGKCIVASLHEIPLASQWCTRLVVINEGTIVADGDPSSILTDELMQEIYGVEVMRVNTEGKSLTIPVKRI